ncbi:MAG: hypothetical protein IJ387_12270, partial [Thermoguttaceae bacterium]|nr:hypothetical protein [Thermoguttaceae bacterium]
VRARFPLLDVAFAKTLPVLSSLTSGVEEAAQVGAGFIREFAGEAGRFRVEFERDFRFLALRSRQFCRFYRL